jgi:hypothetical protein
MTKSPKVKGTEGKKLTKLTEHSKVTLPEEKDCTVKSRSRGLPTEAPVTPERPVN